MVAIFADSNRARIRIAKELNNAWGVIPASGVTREMRYTSSSLTPAKNTVISDEIRADRMVPDHIEVGASSSGDINFDFSAGSHDDFFESFMYGAWTRPMTFDMSRGTSLTWANSSTLYINGHNVINYFTAGRRVRTNGFLNAVNNDYWQISTITWNSGANRTEIVMTASTAVAEAGQAVSVLYDANDVIVLKSTVIRAGTSGASTFDSNGGNVFAGAIAAGQIVAGQKIFVEGLGIETGTVTLSGLPTAGARVTIGDGKKTWIFQYGGSGGNSVTVVTIGANATDCATNLKIAINQERLNGNLDCSAKSTAGVVTVKNQNATGGSIVESVLDGNVAVATFSGGDASVRGVYTIVAATDDVLTVSPQPATNANGGALAVTVKGSMLRNPSLATDITPQSFTFETGFEDVSQYFLVSGLRVGTFNLNFIANEILKGSFTFMGASAARQITSKLGDIGTYSALQTTATTVMNATVNVGSLKVNGQPMSTAIKSIDLKGNNNLRDQNAVSYKFPAGIGAGRMEIDGTISAYFADGSLWDKFIAHNTASVEFNVSSVETHHYEFTIPAIVFATDKVSPSGGNQDVMEDIEYKAKRDPVTDCQIQIDRFSCTYPPCA